MWHRIGSALEERSPTTTRAAHPSTLLMDPAARKLLESVTHETLHAQNFARSSTQASGVLTDVLHRYLELLTTTCAKYAEHAGRLSLTFRDALSALDELGLPVNELSEYAATEGRDLARYTGHSQRRVEDLAEFKGQSRRPLHPTRFHPLCCSLLGCGPSRRSRRCDSARVRAIVDAVAGG